VSIDNLATPGVGGDCVVVDDVEQCSTHHTTPPVTTFVVKKVDSETGDALAGAKFELWIDKGKINVLEPGIDVPLGEKTTGAGGTASWSELLKDHYLIQETQAPPGYGLPAVTVYPIDLTGAWFDHDYVADPFIFQDPSIGNLAIVAKQQYTKNQNGDWVKRPDHGYQVEFGERVKYTLKVEATGTKLFHNVKVQDWVPGFNPEDTHQFGTGSTMKATLVPGSARCSGLPCDVTVSPGNLVTWNFGTVKHDSATVEMIVVFPQAPANPNYNADGFFFASLWNVGKLAYDTAVTSGGMVHTVLRSNEVEIEALKIEPPPGVVPCTKHCLPNTGSSPYLLQLGALGGLALLAGTALVVRGRRRGEATE
jgi:LPXTG-motif cell wall-anchored protein